MMTRVVEFDEATMAGLSKHGLGQLLVEFDEHGYVQRELGISGHGKIAHRFPGRPTLDEYGMLVPNIIAITGENPSPLAILMDATSVVPLETFEELWASD